MDHALQLAPLAGDDRHHEALVTDGDELLLEDAFLAMRAQEAFEGFLNGLLLAFDVAAQAGERHAGVIGHRAIGQDLALEVFQQGTEIADGLRAAAEAGETLGGGGDQRFGIGGAVEQQEEIEDFLGVEAGAFDAQLVDGRFDVGQAGEIDANRGAPRGGLRARGRAQVFDGLAGFREVAGQTGAIGVRSDFFQLAAAQRAGDVSAQQLAEGFEF